MAYLFYLDTLLLPVPPEKLTVSVNNQNETMRLINDGEINLLKQAGLTEISFDCLLPNVSYPFSTYNNGFQKAIYFLDAIEELKVNQTPFQVIVNRALPSGRSLHYTNITVTLEEYEVVEEAEEGFDVIVKMELKQYKEYGTKVCSIQTDSSGTSSVSVEETRETMTAPTPTRAETYTVVSGDSLWAIAKRYYGDGSKYTEIFNANSSIISNASLIYPGQVLTIPVL